MYVADLYNLNKNTKILEIQKIIKKYIPKIIINPTQTRFLPNDISSNLMQKTTGSKNKFYLALMPMSTYQ